MRLEGPEARAKAAVRGHKNPRGSSLLRGNQLEELVLLVTHSKMDSSLVCSGIGIGQKDFCS